jgi:hypothetical protein
MVFKTNSTPNTYAIGPPSELLLEPEGTILLDNLTVDFQS